MMKAITLVPIIAAFTVSIATAANIDVFEMGISTEVVVDGGRDFDWVSTPINPYVATHHAKLGLTEANTQIDIEWGPTGGRFDFLFDHVIEDGPEFGDTITVGGVGVTSDVDLWLDYEYTFSFSNLNGGINLSSRNQVAKAMPTGADYILRTIRHGGSGALAPTSGTFVTNQRVLLEANEMYGISYSNTIHGGEDSGALGIANGSLHLTLTPVPEPTTALLLTSAFVVIRRRTRNPA